MIYIQKRCKSMRAHSSRSQICAPTNSRRVASQNVRKTGFFDAFSTALRSIFFAPYIGKREVILRVGEHLFHIHHFCVGPMVKYLIAREVLMGFLKNAKRNCGTASVRTVVNSSHSRVTLYRHRLLSYPTYVSQTLCPRICPHISRRG